MTLADIPPRQRRSCVGKVDGRTHKIIAGLTGGNLSVPAQDQRAPVLRTSHNVCRSAHARREIAVIAGVDDERVVGHFNAQLG